MAFASNEFLRIHKRDSWQPDSYSSLSHGPNDSRPASYRAVCSSISLCSTQSLSRALTNLKMYFNIAHVSSPVGRIWSGGSMNP